MDAHKISSTLIILLIFSLYSSSIVCQTHDSLITEVENGLLPYVLIKGEPSFNLNDRMEYYKVPGISIAVIKDFQVEWSKQYGVLDSEIKNKVTEETIFNIGSLSKGVTALTVLSLVEEGKIDLDNNINDQLISWKIPENNFTELGTVTPLLLLNHSGGAIFMPGVVYSSENFPTNLQILKGEPPSKTKPVVIDKVPGTEFQYSNAGYSI